METAGARSLGFHRDNAYLSWYTPTEMFSCWIALDDTVADGGTMEIARGSHRWPTQGDQMGEFHAPDDCRATVTAAAETAGVELDLAPVEVPAGGGSFHHGWAWHGSGPNSTDRHRRALVLQSEAAMGPASFFLTDDAVIAERMHRAFEGAAAGDDGWVDLSRGLEREHAEDGQRWSDITDETTNRGFWHHYRDVMADVLGDRQNSA